jgi:8-oxo-dGTP diphosphatase
MAAAAAAAAAKPVVRVGVAAIVCKGRSNLVLVGKRKGSHGAGKWALPGGHLEMWEEWAACAAREVEEETGLRVSSGFRLVHVSNDMMREDGKHYITLFMLGVYDGAAEPRVCEPDKCEGWQWVEWGERGIPQPRFIPLDNILASSFRLEHDSAK